MDSNNIVAAPQLRNVDTSYADWKLRHVGDREDFYKFMATPSVERELFLSENDIDLVFVGQVLCPVITGKFKIVKV